MPHFICIAKFTSKSGKEEELIKELSLLIEPTRAEKGCIRYELNRDILYPSMLTMVEVFQSKAEFDFHSSQNYLAQFKKKSATLVDSIEVILGTELEHSAP